MKEFFDIKSVVQYILEQEFVGSRMTPTLLDEIKARLIEFLPEIIETKLIIQSSEIHQGQILIDYKGEVTIRPDMENWMREYYEREQYLKYIDEALLFFPQESPSFKRRYPAGGCRVMSGAIR